LLNHNNHEDTIKRDFKFKVGDRVVIIDNGMTGEVTEVKRGKEISNILKDSGNEDAFYMVNNFWRIEGSLKLHQPKHDY